ncbi:hypothetical protein NHX12_018801 [Muraenolepis orangiensis]|uniref:Programmed cell death protein 4 n=1 Tax=Muraenolepis orangiensis TaxID=630683 RepID=A0A9Q0EYV3_9TELE|nr:hypothetical protein NHX12_018801 [Muraenolepis orangiensis]
MHLFQFLQRDRLEREQLGFAEHQRRDILHGELPCSQMIWLELLGELHLGPMSSGVPMLAVSLALEAKASHRELTSRLLVVLCGPVLTLGDLESGFDKLLCELPDQLLDTPGAPQLVGQFIAPAVKDQILPKSYIEGYKGRVDCEHARAALDRAAVLLRMISVWTPCGGDRKEVESGLRELEMPHFLHEFVYEVT